MHSKQPIEAGQRLLAMFGDMSDEHVYGKIPGDMSEQPRSRETLPNPKDERSAKIRKGLYLAACTLLVGSALVGGGNILKNSLLKPSANIGSPDKTIESVTIYPGAKLREAPAIPDEYDPNNIEAVADTTVTVPIRGEGAVQPDPANGEWYKVPKSALKSVDPDLNPSSDVWVSTQKADASRTVDPN